MASLSLGIYAESLRHLGIIMEHSAEWMLESAMRYVAAYYGGTLAHHILSLALIAVQRESHDNL